MVKRILFSLFLLLSILFAPFWLSAILALFGMFYFNFFIESIILLFIEDLMYGAKETRFFNIVIVSSAVAIFVFILIQLFKKETKFYKK